MHDHEVPVPGEESEKAIESNGRGCNEMTGGIGSGDRCVESLKGIERFGEELMG